MRHVPILIARVKIRKEDCPCRINFERRQMKRSTRTVFSTIVVAISFLLSFSTPAFSFNKKLEVVAEKAYVYLDPDQNSPIIETIAKGTILTLGSELKFRTAFYYVYFTSLKTGKSRTGYVLDSVVDKLFQSVKVINIGGEEDNLRGGRTLNGSLKQPKWGISREKFLKLEGQPIRRHKSAEGVEIFEYRKKILDVDCQLEYVFAENQLMKMKFNFLAQYDNKNQYVEDYNKIKEVFSGQFGKPEAENIIWQNPLYKEDYSSWGLALYLGHLELSSQWLSPETEVSLALSKKQDGISLRSEYNGVRFKELAKRLAI